MDQTYQLNLSGAVMKRLALFFWRRSVSPAWRRRRTCPPRRRCEAPQAELLGKRLDLVNTSADDCPMSAYGITLYGTLDVGLGYESWGTTNNPSADKNDYGIQKSGRRGYLAADLQRAQHSVIGLKMKEDLAPLGLAGWSLVGVLEAGVNPYSGMFLNPPRSLADQNFSRANQISLADVELQLEPQRVVDELAGLFRHQQQDLGHPDLRPHQLAELRYAEQIRSAQLHGVLADRLLELVPRLRRHRTGPPEHGVHL